MTVSSLKAQQERLIQGRIRIPNGYLYGRTEQQIRDLCDDKCRFGVIWALHTFTPLERLTMTQIGLRCGWGRSAVKNNLKALMERGLLRTSINQMNCVRNIHGESAYFYFNNHIFSSMPFEEVKAYYCNTSYKDPCAPNPCEEAILEISIELFPYLNFRFTGARLKENEVCGYYPDIICDDYPIIIEHNGSPFHSTPEKIEYDRKRNEMLRAKGYFILVITDYEKRNRNIIKNDIKEFVDDAIQNFQ